MREVGPGTFEDMLGFALSPCAVQKELSALVHAAKAPGRQRSSRWPAKARPSGGQTILPRIEVISLAENARSVCVLTLPSLATDRAKAVMASSSGASNTATTSNCPSVQ